MGRRVAAVSIGASGLLSALNIAIGFAAGSTSAVAAGFEFLGDVLASVLVLAGMILLAILIRGVMSTVKFRVGRRIGSGSLIADAWNDAVDILSALAALCALALTLYNPTHFLVADHYGAFCSRSVRDLYGHTSLAGDGDGTDRHDALA